MVKVVRRLEKVEDLVAILDWSVEGREDMGAAEEVEGNYGVEFGGTPGKKSVRRG